MRKQSYISGAIGGFAIVALFILFYFATSLFNYKLVFEPVYINNASANINISTRDAYYEKYTLLKELSSKGVILTPQEYTNNVISYYNIAFLIMSAMLVAFTLFSFIHYKMIIREQLHEVLKSKEIEESVVSQLKGKVEESMAEQIEALQSRMAEIESSIKKRLSEIESAEVISLPSAKQVNKAKK